MDSRADVNGVIGTYHASMLMQYVKRQRLTFNRFMSIESVAEVYEADEADEYSLDGSTFPSAQRMESCKEIIISNEISNL